MATHSIARRRRASKSSHKRQHPLLHASIHAGDTLMRSQSHGTARLCLYLLALFAQADRTIRISYSDLAPLLGFPYSQECNAPIAELIRLGELEVAAPSRGSLPRTYRLLV